MTISSQPSDSPADQRAALWAARLDGDHLDSAQRADLDAWLAQNPDHRQLLTRYCQFSADLELKVSALVAEGGVTMPATAKRTKRRGRIVFRFAAAMLATAAAIVVTFAVLRPARGLETFAMASLERGARTLADGTRVELNANTGLRFENHPTERRVRLTGGEALFMVAKDPARPFFVETPTGSVRVTGTTFNVRAEPSAEGFEVTVIEGTVEVHTGKLGATPSAPPVPVGPGEQFSAHASASSKQLLSPSDLDDALAWRVGKIIFHNTPLAEALARYGRYHGRTIQIDPAIAGESVGGRYSIDDISGFLHGIESYLPVKVRYDLSSGGAVVVNAQPRH